MGGRALASCVGSFSKLDPTEVKVLKMKWMEEQKRAVFDKTDGRCHICRKNLSFKNHGCDGKRGAWHIDHSNAQANGGGHGLNNLLPACCGCNIEKSAGSTRAARKRSGHGKTRAPMSKVKKHAARTENTVLGGLGGLIVGGLAGGPLGAVLGTIGGAVLGSSADPEE